MRIFVVLCSIVLLSGFGFGQGWQCIPGFYAYGCGPYIPLTTTPSLSLVTVSPNPTGATNATGGLVAGATDSTLSQVAGDPDSVYTMSVWYSGGQTPLRWPVRSEAPGMKIADHERRMRTTGFEESREPGREGHREIGAPQAWIYFGSAEPTGAPGETTAGEGKNVRTYTNEDVTRQNHENGFVKYKDKMKRILPDEQTF